VGSYIGTFAGYHSVFTVSVFVNQQPKKEFVKILLGTVVVFISLLIFLAGIDYGFAFAGKYIGEVFLDPSRPEWFKWLLLIVAFI